MAGTRDRHYAVEVRSAGAGVLKPQKNARPHRVVARALQTHAPNLGKKSTLNAKKLPHRFPSLKAGSDARLSP